MTGGKISIFIKKLQTKEEAVKKRWLIGLSGASMVIVLGLWLVYINIVINPLALETEKTETLSTDNNEPGFSQTIEAGITKIKGIFKTSGESAFGFLKNKASTANLITIEKKEINFVPKNLEIIPKTKLP